MLVRNYYGELLNVFGVYWYDNKTCFWVFPKDTGGLMVFELGKPGDRDRVTIADPNWSGNFLFDNRIPGIFHHAIVEEDLLLGLSEKDEKAYVKFLNIIKEEGLVDQEFY
ncbi:hypothetical protein ABRZ24_12045 [Brenneria populi]|uniref:Uncharacterized protein n=1 Tax=Brenneria populi TaxID=1505588 RepID=A0ABU6JRJ0_9GAMM|nr:hypothetical protein [Brenneria populi Li et al. 2015]